MERLTDEMLQRLKGLAKKAPREPFTLECDIYVRDECGRLFLGEFPEFGLIIAEVERLRQREQELTAALETTAQNVHLLRLPMMGPHTMKTVADTIENAAIAVLKKEA